MQHHSSLTRRRFLQNTTAATAALTTGWGSSSPVFGKDTPEDIARVVSFLLSPDGGWINGQTVRANGGMV